MSDVGGRGRAERIRRWLVHARWPWVVALIGLVLPLPSLSLGFMVDDMMHAHYLRGGDVPGGPEGIWDMYRFADGGPGVRRAIDQGMFAWWSSTDLKFAFFRPLSSLWVALDHRLFAGAPWVSHLEGCVLYAVLCLLVGLLFRRVLPGAVGGLAALLFAVDDAHHFPVMWLANRHAVLSAVLGVAAMLAHVKRRQDGGGAIPAWVSPLLLALALSAGESTLGFLPYIAGWAWWMDPGGRRAGLRSLLPHAAVLAAWAVTYVVGDFGSKGSGLYLDPAAQPLAFLGAAAIRLPRLLLAQLFLPPADIWPLIPPDQALVPDLISLAVLFAVGGGLWWATRRHPAQRFLAFGTVLGLLPCCAVFPSDRLLLLSGIGASGLVAIAVVEVGRDTARASRGAFAFAGLLAVVHLFLAASLFPLRTVLTGDVFTRSIERGAKTIPVDPGVRGKTMLILATPDSLMTTYMFMTHLVAGDPVPARSRILVVSQRGSVTIRREDDRTLVATASESMLSDIFSLLYRKPDYAAGQRFDAGDMKAEVLSLDGSGFPRSVRFRFEEAISPENQRWLVWEGQGYREVGVMAVGEEMVVPSTDWLTAMSP